jgi:hypothetical protein
LGEIEGTHSQEPCHDLSRKIILINFYVRLPKQQKEFLDNSSGGSFTNNYEEAWNLLETISENTGTWDLDKGNKPHLEYEYFRVEFSTSTLFEHLSEKFGLDPYVLVEIAKSFAGHNGVPKSGFEFHVEPVKHSIVVPKVIKQVDQVSCAKIEEYIEAPPYPNKVKENLLIIVTNKSKKRCSEPYETVDVDRQILVIKQLNEEYPVDVYLCEDATKVIKGESARVGKPIIPCAIGTSCYHGLCDIGSSISVIPYLMGS